MGFRDDVVVRVRAEPDGARIDARSSSRYGTFDFGTNAARIRRLMTRHRGSDPHTEGRAAGAAAGGGKKPVPPTAKKDQGEAQAKR